MTLSSGRFGLTLILGSALLLGGLSGWLEPNAWGGKVLNDALVSRPFSHRVWQDVIYQFADAQGQMQLVRLRAHPARLNEYIEQLATASPESHPDYFRHRNDQLAYWINAYNAVALRLILDRYPLEDLTPVTDFETLPRYRLGGRPYSLSQIRQKIQARFPAQPEALMALTHYTQDSPPLAHTAFEGPQLEAQLLAQAGRALAALEPTLTADTSDCPVLPFWLESLQGPLFNAAQHRQMGEQAIDWNVALYPYLTLSQRERFDCPGSVQFAAPDLTLRQIR